MPLNYKFILNSKITMVVNMSTLANVSHEFGLVWTFVHPSVRLPECEFTGQGLRICFIFFFLIFYIKLESQKVIKVTEPFWTGQEGPKRSKNDPKKRFFEGFDKESNLFLCTAFNSVWKWEWCCIYLQKALLCKKSSFWVMVQKLQNPGLFKVLYVKNELRYEANFLVVNKHP